MVPGTVQYGTVEKIWTGALHQATISGALYGAWGSCARLVLRLAVGDEGDSPKGGELDEKAGDHPPWDSPQDPN